MNFSGIQQAFDRAILTSWNGMKLVFVFAVLALCGLFAVFFRGLAAGSGDWVLLATTFFPLFLCAGLLLATGIFVIRTYYAAQRRHTMDLSSLLRESGEFLLGASFFSIPMILCYLALWMLLGIFVLLTEIPGLGPFFGVLLSFAPFLLNLGALLLLFAHFVLLFFLAPIMARHGLNRLTIVQMLWQRLRRNFFANSLLLAIAFLPLVFVGGFLSLAAYLTTLIYSGGGNLVMQIVQEFFIMIPYAAAFTPAVILFFHFSAEAHALIFQEEISAVS